MLPETMTVIEAKGHGGPDVLVPGKRPVPAPGPGEVLIEVKAAGVNRPDVLQRQGLYPAPKGASDLLGLEVAGNVAACGPGAARYKIGDAVCALTNGGGYAEFCVAPESATLPVPEDLSLVEAAALPETVAEDHLVVAPRLSFFAKDVPSQHGTYAQSGKNTSRYV